MVRLDCHGDIEAACRIIRHRSDDINSDATIVLMKRDVLAEYSKLTGSKLVRTFDSTRMFSKYFGGWNNPAARQREVRRDVCNDLYYDIHVEKGNASFTRGVQVVHFDVILAETLVVKKYETFVGFDWKNGETKEISCSPSALANYFTESDLPYELTPAFFRPEVLSKFKSDREKYTLTNRSVSCRGSWHLQTYDINAEGQVHTYLIYLSRLPYDEQLHWKQYNEVPKGPISKRAFKTDFAADWSYAEYDPLTTLKTRLGSLRCRWWKLRSQDAMDWAHYPVTQSNDEWRNEILTLDQLVVEGFEEKWLRKFALRLGRTPNPKMRSLALLEECLIGIGVEDENARSIVFPLRRLSEHRNKLRGHAAVNSARLLKSQAFESYGGYREQYTSLVAECDAAIKFVIEILPEQVDE